jgi:hypothetical protein
MRRRGIRPLAFGLVLLVGCARLRPAPRGINVSSEASYYSPVVRLAVAIPLTSDSAGGGLTVIIDSGWVRVPGKATPDSLPLVQDLYLKALLVTVPRRSRRTSTEEPWISLGESDSLAIADALSLGEEQVFGPARLQISVDSAFDPTKAMLVFSIVGAGVAQEARLADGRVLPRRRAPGAVRVYACADWTIAGYVDRRRRQQLTRAYNAAC